MTTPPDPRDTTVALPVRSFEFTPGTAAQAASLLAQPPGHLLARLLRDQESEAVLLASRRILAAFLDRAHQEDAGSEDPRPAASSHPEDAGSDDPQPAGFENPQPAASHPEDALTAAASARDIAAVVARVRTELAVAVTGLLAADPGPRDAVLRQRAPLALVAGCWLDVVSQPATQPSVIVNRLFAQHFTLRGAGNPRLGLAARRRQRLEEDGIYLPETGAPDFLAQAGARPLTALHGCLYLALSRLPANFLPELTGMHYAFFALGVDDLLGRTPPMLAEPDLREVLAAYLDLAGPVERARLHTGLRLALRLEREHVTMLAELAAWRAALSLESRVAEIISRHAPYAGRQHQDVRVGGRRLAGTFADPDLDVAAFMTEFREAVQLRRTADGGSRFVKAMKFGGPMFGIFTDREAATFQGWVESVQAGERPEIVLSANTAGDARAAAWSAALAASAPADVVLAEPGPLTDRELFRRLVNIENFPSTLPLAAERAARLFADAEVLFGCGADGRYTDASWFDYTPEALYARSEQVYWEKLVEPYQPLTEIPDRDEVVFLQTTYALGALIDAAWIHRMANLGRSERPADAALFAIYADEVGHGDLRKNHITLIYRALRSMGIELPHIREDAFMDQGDLPDDLYGFSLHQLCMAVFPDRYHAEILGYNLAIEMFGLGELRLHEIQKLRRYGFDDCYEQAHLTIDNLSAGHSRQAADIIVTHLDETGRSGGDAAVQREWRRVWGGYASLAWFVEHALVKNLPAPANAGVLI